MDKKNRTGLQSKISNIFAGVPIPKKKTPDSEPPQAQNNNEITEVTLPSQDDDIVIEESMIEKDITRPEEVQSGIEDKTNVEFSGEQRLEEELSDEQFTVIEDEDTELKAPKHADKTEIDEPQGIKDLNKPEIHVEETGDTSFDKLLSPDISSAPEPVTSEPKTQKPVKQEPKTEKPSIEDNIPVPSVTEPAVEKTAQSFKQKIEIGGRKTVGTPNMSMGKIPGVEAVKRRDLRPSPKISSKPAVKRLKSKQAVSRPRQKVMIVLIIALSIALVLILGKQFNLFPKNSDASVPLAKPGSEIIVTKSNKEIKIEWPVPPIYPDNLPNPFEIPKPETINPSADNTQKFIVKGISIVNGNYLLLIGTDFFKVGDEVHGAKITKITDTYAQFDRDGKVWTQNVGE